MPDDPFSISALSRSKLNAYRYPNINTSHMSALNSNHDSKAINLAGSQDSRSSLAINPMENALTELNKETPQSNNRDTKVESICPHTPAHRIPLADLISNTEDAFSKAPGKVLTPDDHVYWDHRSPSSKNKLRSSVRRGKKRARSSSPASSPLNRDLSGKQTAQRVLKTPQHDVAAELWSKYVGKNNGKGGGDLPKFQLSQLRSSPRTPAPQLRGTRDGSGLRRANSCNVDWPTSNSKRRKLDYDQQRTSNIRDGLTRSRTSLLAPDRPKSSKIGLLVEKIQETFLKHPRDDSHAPSSSSPLPDRSDSMDDDCPEPPTKQLIQKAPHDTPSKNASGPRHDNQTRPGTESKVTSDFNETSSDFGDDDLDRDFLELAVASPKKLFPVEETFQNRKGPVQTIEDIPKLEPAVRQQEIVEENKSDILDGFGDDFDEFDDGIEEIMAQFDEKNLSAGQTTVENQAKVSKQTKIMSGETTNRAESKNKKSTDPGAIATFTTDDEFDDDIDLEAIENAMLKAPEVADASNKVSLPLCLARQLRERYIAKTYSSILSILKPFSVTLYLIPLRTPTLTAMADRGFKRYCDIFSCNVDLC